jgi:hypothetical protein
MVVVKMCGAGCKKRLASWASLSICANLVVSLNRGYIVCTRPFFALSYLEVNLLVLVEICVTCSFHFRVMDEQIIAAVIGSNKTITFVCIKPFYCS